MLLSLKNTISIGIISSFTKVVQWVLSVHMIQVGSYLNVVDNSGAKKVVFIRINASCKKR